MDVNCIFLPRRHSFIVMAFSVGDKVIISKYSGTQVKLDGVEYTISEIKDILAVVE